MQYIHGTSKNYDVDDCCNSALNDVLKASRVGKAAGSYSKLFQSCVVLGKKEFEYRTSI